MKGTVLVKWALCHQVIFSCISLFNYAFIYIFSWSVRNSKRNGHLFTSSNSWHQENILRDQENQNVSCSPVFLLFRFRIVYKLRSDIRGWIVKLCLKQSAWPGERQQSRTIDSRPRNHINQRYRMFRTTEFNKFNSTALINILAIKFSIQSCTTDHSQTNTTFCFLCSAWCS